MRRDLDLESACWGKQSASGLTCAKTRASEAHIGDIGRSRDNSERPNPFAIGSHRAASAPHGFLHVCIHLKRLKQLSQGLLASATGCTDLNAHAVVMLDRQ